MSIHKIVAGGYIGINTQTYMKLTKTFNINLEFLVSGRGRMFYKAVPDANDKKI